MRTQIIAVATRLGCLHGRLSGSFGTRCARRKGQRTAWKLKPNWYLVSTEDKMIPPDAQSRRRHLQGCA